MFNIKEAKVLVDTRERKKKGDPKETFHLVKKLCPAAIEEYLLIGDINFKDVYVELKDIMDFISSIKDKRFRNQLHDLRKENPGLKVFYYIYFNEEVKTWSDIKKYSKMHPNAVWGAISSIQSRYGVYCFPYPTKKHAIWSSIKSIEKTYDGKGIEPQTYYLDLEKMAVKDDDGITRYKVTTDVRAINFLRSGAERCREKAVINALIEYDTPLNVINELVKDPKEFTKKIKFWGKETTDRYLELLKYRFNDPPLINGSELIEKEIEKIIKEEKEDEK